MGKRAIKQVMDATAGQARVAQLVHKLDKARKPGHHPNELTAEMLIAFVGEDRAVYLMEHFGQSRIPSARRYLELRRAARIVKAWKEEGWSVPELALRYRMGEATIRNILRPHRPVKGAEANALSVRPLTGTAI
jgi:hypothetical protein